MNEQIRKAEVNSKSGTDSAALELGVGALLGISVAAVLILALEYLLAPFLVGPGLPAAAKFFGVGISVLIGVLVVPETGDYDMRLTGVLRLRYRYALQLDALTKQHILDKLLTETGDPSGRKDFVWVRFVPTIVPRARTTS